MNSWRRFCDSVFGSRRTTVIFVDTIEDVIAQQNGYYNQPQIIMITRINNEENCPICRDQLNDGDGIKTECGHNFHKDCIVAWIRSGQRQRYKCPMCVQNMTL